MKNMVMIVLVVALTFAFFVPEQASAQLFRRWQDKDNSRDETSHLPGADPRATRAPDYGAERVSEDIRNEVNGRVTVRPAPDFLSDAPLAQAAKQYQNPISYVTQRPVGQGTRVQPPTTTRANSIAALPHWITAYDVTESSDKSDLSPTLDGGFQTAVATEPDVLEAVVSLMVSETQNQDVQNQEPQNGVGKLEWNKDSPKKKTAAANAASPPSNEPAGNAADSADDAIAPSLNEKIDVSGIAEDKPAAPAGTSTGENTDSETKPKAGRVRVPGLSLGTMLLRLSGF